MARSLAPYIHVILADVVSITLYINKPLVRLTTAHYQSTVSMISFAQVLTVQWSDTIPCRNVQFQVGITSHNILFQQDLYDHVSCEDPITTSVRTSRDSRTQTSVHKRSINHSASTSSQQLHGQLGSSLHAMSLRSISRSLSYIPSHSSQPPTLHSSSTSMVDSSLSPMSTLNVGSHGKRTSEQSGVSHSPIPMKKRSCGSQGV